LLIEETLGGDRDDSAHPAIFTIAGLGQVYEIYYLLHKLSTNCYEIFGGLSC